MTDEWLANVHRDPAGGWSWDITHGGLVILVSAAPVRNPGTCAIEAEEWRRRMASGQFIVNDQGEVVPACR